MSAARAQPIAAAPAVELRSIEKTYPGGTRALLPIDLRIGEGEFVTVIGPSGCGKTTLLKLIAGMIEPSAGALRLWDRPAREAQTAGRSVGFVFQAPTLMPWASVQANVRLPLDLARTARRDADARVRDALALVGLTPFARALPHSLSGGMQMRVSIARALVTAPQLLLMDEPFGALDEIARQRLDLELLDLWASRRLTAVFVTHSIHEAVFLSTRVVVMAARPGQIADELRIDEPHPRRPEFLVSPAFARCARQLQDSLLRASTSSAEAATA